MALWENWDVDFIAKRAYPLSLPPLRSKRSTEDQGPLKDKRLKALLDVAPDRAMHQKSLRILHNVSDATSPQTSDQELLYRLREYVGRKRGAFDYTLLNDYVFQIRRCKKTVVKSAPKHKIKKLTGKDIDIWAARQIGEAFDKLGIEYPRTAKTNDKLYIIH